MQEGHHTLMMGQADSGDGFLNLRGARFEPCLEEGGIPDGREIALTPATADPDSLGSIRVEWMNSPVDFGFWASGNSVAWDVFLPEGGVYDGFVTYASPHEVSVLIPAVNDRTGLPLRLESTGGWSEYARLPVRGLLFDAGTNHVVLRWDCVSSEGCGNLRGMSLRRRAETGP